MNVFVVVCDCGLNGAWVEAVCSTEDAAQRIADEVNAKRSSREDAARGVIGYTGFSGAVVYEFEVDGAEVPA